MVQIKKKGFLCYDSVIYTVYRNFLMGQNNDGQHPIPCISYTTEYKITVGHWPFSDQFHYMANQFSFWLATFTVATFAME